MAIATAITDSGGLIAHFIDIADDGSTRADVVAAYARRAVPPPRPGRFLSDLAAFIHRVVPGVRLM